MTDSSHERPAPSFGHEIEIPLPDDFHIHLGQGLALTMYSRDAAQYFGRVMVTPDTTPPILVPRQLEKYRDRILRSSGHAADFKPLMSFRVDRAMGENDIQRFAEAGAVAGVLYPEAYLRVYGSVVDALSHVLEAMQRYGIVLSLYAEHEASFVLDKEESFLPQLDAIVRHFPDLRVVVERISSAAALSTLMRLPPTVAATVTVQHLLYTLDDVVGDVIRPHRFCKPLPRRSEDRDALRQAVCSGNKRVFFGSDSTPLPVASGENREIPPGIYSAPTAIPLLLSLFEKFGSLDSFIAFTAQNGAEFYGLAPPAVRCRYRRMSWDIPERISDVTPLGAGEQAEWRAVGRQSMEV